MLPLPVADSQSELRKEGLSLLPGKTGLAFPQQCFKTKFHPRNEGQYEAAVDGTWVGAREKGQSCHQLLGWRHVRTCCMDTKLARAFSEHTQKKVVVGRGRLAGLKNRQASLKTEPPEKGNSPL